MAILQGVGCFFSFSFAGGGAWPLGGGGGGNGLTPSGGLVTPVPRGRGLSPEPVGEVKWGAVTSPGNGCGTVEVGGTLILGWISVFGVMCVGVPVPDGTFGLCVGGSCIVPPFGNLMAPGLVVPTVAGFVGMGVPKLGTPRVVSTLGRGFPPEVTGTFGSWVVVGVSICCGGVVLTVPFGNLVLPFTGGTVG